MRRCEKMWEDVRRCEKMWEDVRRCEKMWEDVRRCEDEKMWRWEGVKMRRCEDEKMWRWEDEGWGEDVRIRRCEDEKMWRWEDVKMRRCFTDPHYWKNPALRRSREKVPLKRVQNHKHGSNAHCTATPMYPPTKSQTLGSCPHTLKTLLRKILLYSPQRLGFCRGNSRGYIQHLKLILQAYLVVHFFCQNLAIKSLWDLPIWEMSGKLSPFQLLQLHKRSQKILGAIVHTWCSTQSDTLYYTRFYLILVYLFSVSSCKL